ncbi:hypothetical protein J4Q44_G00047880 [Coregonus suidteri]|uniref:Uncharacterized protein n=1 Tax=Coregonus suidteri TaxID=861788 RepID=A0AAN8R4U8_9TELE
MSKLQLLNVFVTERLSAAAVEIFGAVEKTIAEYREEICRSAETNERHRRQLDMVSKPQITLHRADFQLLTPTVPPEQQNCEQEWSPSLGQEDPEPTQIKEEQQELRLSQEDSPQPSHLYQNQTVDDGERGTLPIIIIEELLNVFVTERLSATAAEIFEAVEKTIAEYQEEIFRSAEENERLRREMDMVIKQDIKLHRTDFQLLTPTVPPEQQNCEQEWSPSLGQEDPEPTQIKEEQQELRLSQEDSPQPSHLYQNQTVDDGERGTLPIIITEEIKTEPDGEGYKLLNVFVTERLSAAAVEIFGAVEKTIAEYQEEICRSAEENESLRRLLDMVIKPEIKLHRADFQLLTPAVPPDQQNCEQEWSPSLGQEDPEPTQIKEEQQELRLSQEDSPQPSHLYQNQTVDDGERGILPIIITEEIKTEPDGEGYRVPEPTSDQPLSVHPDFSAAVEKTYRCKQCGNSFTRTPASWRILNIPTDLTVPSTTVSPSPIPEPDPRGP